MFSLSQHWVAICVVPAAITGELGSDNRLHRLDVKKGCYNNKPTSSQLLTILCVSVTGQEEEGGKGKFIFLLHLLLSVSPASPQIRVLAVNALHDSFLKKGIKANLKQSMP